MNQAPYAIAVAAGMLAAVNPCGFVLLPAYLTLLVAGETPHRRGDHRGRLSAIGRALTATAAMTTGFVAVFAAFGLVVAPLALSVEHYLPWATVVIGIALAGLGGWLLAGRDIPLMLPKPRPGRPARSLRWATSYGVAYAVASLSCTVAPFLALTTTALRSGSIASGVAIFAAYAAGMGLVVGVLSLSTALARDGLAARLRRALPYVNRAGGALLILAGTYVAYYGWYEIRLLSGAGTDDAAGDPIVGTATRIQGTVTRWLSDVGAGPLAVALALLTTAALVLALRRTRRPRQAEESGETARASTDDAAELDRRVTGGQR